MSSTLAVVVVAGIVKIIQVQYVQVYLFQFKVIQLILVQEELLFLVQLVVQEVMQFFQL